MRIRLLLCLTLLAAALTAGCDNADTGDTANGGDLLERAWNRIENSFSGASTSADHPENGPQPGSHGPATNAQGRAQARSPQALEKNRETPPENNDQAQPAQNRDTRNSADTAAESLSTADTERAPGSEAGAQSAPVESTEDKADPLSVDIPEVDIDATKYVLDNGLTLIVHTDHKTPIVAVNIWYHVGSKNEDEGQHGFAHLFEHLMFQGSEHWQGEYFEPFERAGATDMNGTTNADRTNYFASVPTSALDMALWMESDRMGHFLGAIDQNLLDEQRGVVLN